MTLHKDNMRIVLLIKTKDSPLFQPSLTSREQPDDLGNIISIERGTIFLFCVFQESGILPLNLNVPIANDRPIYEHI